MVKTAVLNRVIQVDLTKNIRVGHRLERGRGMNYRDIWEKSFLRRENSQSNSL